MTRIVTDSPLAVSTLGRPLRPSAGPGGSRRLTDAPRRAVSDRRGIYAQARPGRGPMVTPSRKDEPRPGDASQCYGVSVRRPY